MLGGGYKSASDLRSLYLCKSGLPNKKKPNDLLVARLPWKIGTVALPRLRQSAFAFGFAGPGVVEHKNNSTKPGSFPLGKFALIKTTKSVPLKS